MTEQPTGPINHLIRVESDLGSSTLIIAQPSVVIKPGDRVIWEFSGIPDGWVPWIEFRPDSDFFGPLADLTQSAATVWGTCRAEPSLVGQGFAYRASIQKGWGTGWENGTATIHSNAAGLTIASAETGAVQRFTVTREGDSLSVSPVGVIIQPGDAVEWIFENVADDAEGPWHPLVVFRRYDGSGEVSNLYLGPHTSLTTQGDRVQGMGNNRVSGTYYFQASAIRISDGQALWISSGDPAIDNRGGAADPTSGGGPGY